MKKLNAIKMLTACGSHFMKLALSLTLVAAMSTGAYADCQLNCNQNVQVSLDGDCEATITYKTMLQDPDNPAICTPNGPSAYVVEVMAADGTVLGDKISKANLRDGWCGVTYLVKVKHWDSGNICWGSIYVEDKLAPEGYAKDIDIYCYEGLPDAATTYARYTSTDDNCDHVSLVSHTTRPLFDDCDPNLINQGYCGVFERVYTIADKCGNTSQFSHSIKVRSVNPILPPDVTISCKDGDTSPGNTGYPTIGGYDLTPGNLVGYCKWGTSYEDWVTDICEAGGSKQVRRTWKIVNKCNGDFYTHVQVIDVENEGPWVDGLNAEQLWLGTNSGSHACDYIGTLPIPRYKAECAPIVAIHASVFFVDANGYKHPSPIATEVDILNGGLVRIPEGRFAVEYTFFDECHATTFYDTDGAVYDATAPTAIADTETSIDLSPNVNGSAGSDDCVTSLHAYDLDSGSYDNCKEVKAYVARMGADGTVGPFGPKVNFTADDACTEQMVVFRVYEVHLGTENSKDQVLYSEVMVNVDVQDAVIALTNLQDKVIDCSGDDDWNAADAFDTPRLIGCSAQFDGDPIDVVTERSCGQSVYKRTWNAINCKGNKASVSQTIRIRYVGTIDFTCPKDVDFDCGEGETAETLTEDRTGKPVVTVTGCASAAVSEPYDEVFRHEGEGDGCFKIKRSWNIIDWCNGGTYVGSCYQLITVTDKVRPVVSCDDVDVCITDGCDATFAVPAPQISDCTATTTTVDWVFNGKDGSTASGTISVGANVTFGPGVLSLKYIVRDACGNFGNAACDVTITDCKDPTPFCRDIGTAIMNNGEITIWASDFLLYAEDNCDDAAMVESTVQMRLNGSGDDPASSLTLTCDDLSFAAGFSGVQVDIIVTDMAGNSDFCTTSFQVQDNGENCSGSGGAAANITANFNSEEGESIENVSVNLTGGAMNVSQMTTSSGVAQFSNLPMHGEYEVSGEKNMNYLNGVSTYDVVLLTRHILGINKLDSPYKLIAGDVNGSGKISTGDVLALRRAILAITDDFGDNNTSWRFVDASYAFPDPSNPFAEAFPEKMNVADLDHDMNAEFVSVKIGDINGSAKPNELLGSDDLEGSALKGTLEHQVL